MSSTMYTIINFLLIVGPLAVCLIWHAIAKISLLNRPQERRGFFMKLNSVISFIFLILSCFWTVFMYLAFKIVESM